MPERTIGLEPRVAALTAWARAVWPGGDPGEAAARPIPADGSPRLFVRLTAGGRSLVALANPDNPPENRAWHFLAGHLAGLGLPVARVLAADPDGGRFLMEDLGAESLQEAVLAAGGEPEAVAALYEPALAALARLQAHGHRGMDLSLCFDGPELTPEFLRRREAGYFLERFVTQGCGLGPEAWPAGLERDLDRLCRAAGLAAPRGLVHRDYQSRNLVRERGRLGLVDFQGARLGPAQYDLAALVHDPYVDLPWELRRRLVERYLELRDAEGPFDRQAFRQGWPFVAASRLMQALGAYAFLTMERRRAHFAAFAAPALAALKRLAATPPLDDLSALGELLAQLPARPRLAPEEDL